MEKVKKWSEMTKKEQEIMLEDIKRLKKETFKKMKEVVNYLRGT